MKTLFTLKSAKEIGLVIATLILASPMIYPELALASSLQTTGQTQGPVFEIKVKDQNLLNLNPTTQNQTISTLTTQNLAETDPLYISVHQFLIDNRSPLADYTTQLLQKPNWKEILSISFVESNMGIHNYYFNSSGIGGQQYLRKYNNFGEWIEDMSKLLATRYNGWTFDKMNGVYVQPRSSNWGRGTEQLYAKLTAIEQKVDTEHDLALAKTIESGKVLGTFAINEN